MGTTPITHHPQRAFIALLLTALIACLVGVRARAQPAGATSAPPTPSSAANAEKTRDNIVILLDASGSMRETLPGSGTSKMEAAKSAILSVVSGVPQGTNVGLLVFSGHGVANEWVYPIGPVDKDKFQRAIAPLQPEGGTPLGAYIKKAADALLERRKQQSGYGTFRLLVVTDGEASDPGLVDRYTPDVMARGIIVDVIGVNMQSEHTLARKVHLYRRANEAATLNSAISEVFAELSSSTGATDDHSAAAFETIRALPDGTARAVLAAMTTQHDQPIGEQPPPPPGTAAAQPPAPAARPTPPINQSVPAPTSSTIGTSKWFPACFVVGVVVIALFIRGVARSTKGAGR